MWRPRGSDGSWWAGALLAGGAVVMAGCSSEESLGPDGGSEITRPDCVAFEEQVQDGGVGRDGIPALSDPELIPVDDDANRYLQPDDRVIGFKVEDRMYGVPHNILWWHEIVNFDFGPRPLAVTYCPLTGSSMIFSREAVDGAEFGVSGLIFRNNLIMFDRTEEVSFWPQMERSARCGPATDVELEMVPAMELRWDRFTELFPEALVVSPRLPFGRPYGEYPYGDYEEIDNDRTLFPVERIDPRRPPKERVLGISIVGGGGLAFPFTLLAEEGRNRVARAVLRDRPVVVFWDHEARGAMAFDPSSLEEEREFFGDEDGFKDRETGSRWRLDGVAVEGPLAGSRLEPIPEAYVAFWFAWATFHLSTRLWSPDS